MPLLPYNSIVTTHAASKDMTVLATVKTELGLSVTTWDTLLATLIQQASGKAVELAGREFAAETMTDYFLVAGCDPVLQLSRRPIKSITSIVEDGVTLSASDYEAVALTGWLRRIDADGLLIAWASGKVDVVYVAGYTMLTELPHGLERIVIDEVKRQFFSRKRDSLIRQESVDGVGSFSYWVNSGTDTVDPMLTALEDMRFVDPVI